LAATLDFTSFFTMAFLGAAHFFYSWAVFGLDSIYHLRLSNCNVFFLAGLLDASDMFCLSSKKKRKNCSWQTVIMAEGKKSVMIY